MVFAELVAEQYQKPGLIVSELDSTFRDGLLQSEQPPQCTDRKRGEQRNGAGT